MNYPDWAKSVDRLGDQTATMRAEVSVHTHELQRIAAEIHSIRDALNHGENGIIPRLAVIEEQVERILDSAAAPVAAVEERKARITARAQIIVGVVAGLLALIGTIASIIAQVWRK